MENGRIAIPSNGEGGLGGTRAGHFGHCDVFTFIDVENGEIKEVSTIQNQEHSQGGCMVPVNLLAGHKVDALIVGGIGMRPLMGFKQVGIEVYHDDQRADQRRLHRCRRCGHVSRRRLLAEFRDSRSGQPRENSGRA